jgi:hypothetical protein
MSRIRAGLRPMVEKAETPRSEEETIHEIHFADERHESWSQKLS